MFTIRADYRDTVVVQTSLDRVRQFFSDIRNFVEMMPGIEGIHTDANGVAHWKVRVEVPFIGSFTQKFAVHLTENAEERIEWLPAAGETQNLLRYGAEFVEKAANVTLVQFSQNVELRRKSSRDLHPLAGLAGEAVISREMAKGMAEMVKTFVRKAKEKLEKQV
ncbi:MAG: SRPBCC family protein [Pyrinomonadaceae bacterium]